MEVVWCKPDIRGKVLTFLRENMQPLKGDDTYFRWRYESHPLGDALDYCQAVIHGSEVVGFLGALPDRLLAEGKWHDAAWLLDLKIAEKARGGSTLFELLTNA